MKYGGLILVACYAVFTSTAYAKKSVVDKNDSPNPPPSVANKEQGSYSDKEQMKELLGKLVNNDSQKPAKSKLKETKDKPKDAKLNGNATETSEEGLEALLSNVTEAKNLTDEDVAEKPAAYDVKHYLTAEQKYYMLRINLLGIGIRVVHAIVPIPVANTDQYTKAMETLLDRVQEAREMTANMTAGQGMHNITLEDARKLQMKMLGAGGTEAPAAEKKPTNHTTEVLILVGAIVGVIVIAVLIFVCKRSMDGKRSDSSYYDHLQGGGGSVPIN